jgi:hypothetical protein
MLPDPKTTMSAVYVYSRVLHMRIRFDRLAARIQEEHRRSAMQGGWYVFFNRRRDRVQIFHRDRDGYAIPLSTARLASSFKLDRRE